MAMLRTIVTLALLGASAGALAELPPPTPQQVAEQAAKKAKADAEAAESKRLLAESMDALASRWRKQAAAKGWKVNAPTALPPPAPPAVPAMVGSAAPAQPAGTAPGTLVAGPETMATGAIPAGATASAGGVNRPQQAPAATGGRPGSSVPVPAPVPRPAAVGSREQSAESVQASGQAGAIPTAGRVVPSGKPATAPPAGRPAEAKAATPRPAAAGQGARPATQRPAAPASPAQEGRR